MTVPLEVELKLEIAPEDRVRLDRLTALADDPGQTDRLVSTYFDTPECDLREAGYSLRIRRKGKRRIQTVKADGEGAAGLFVRPEWERAVEGDRPVLDEASGPLPQALGKETLGRIGPLFVTDVRRTVRAISTDGARIELAVDQGEVRAGDRRQPLCEIELELEGGPAAALFDLARRLDGDVPLRLGVRTKSERGYDLVEARPAKAAKAEPVRLDPGDDAAAAFQAIARSCIRQFRLNEASLLEKGEVEPLHQARVGLRRLRSAFLLYRPLLEGDARAPKLVGELRWLTSELGRLRNLDVLIPRIEDEAARQALGEARAQALAEARDALTSSRARLLMIDLAEWLALGDWRMHPVDPDMLHWPAARFAGEMLDHHRRRLKRRGKGLAALDDGHRHRARIAAKALRYASEFFAGLYPDKRALRRRKAFLGALEELQDHLGELNDLAIGADLLAKLGIDASLPHTTPRDRARLLARAEEAYDTLMDARRFWR